MFFRILLFLIFIILIIQLLGRFLFGFAKRSMGSSNVGKSYDSNRKEGDVYVDFRNEKRKKVIRKDEGEYVKYEEIKD